MPSYEQKCKKCGNYWIEDLRMSDSRKMLECPKCKNYDTHRVFLTPTSFKINGSVPDDLVRKVEYNLGKAREERQEHEKIYGKYKDYIPEAAKPIKEQLGRDIPEETTYIGNVPKEEADDYFPI